MEQHHCGQEHKKASKERGLVVTAEGCLFS